MIEKKERKPLTGKLKARLIAIIAVAAVVVIGSLTVTYGWFLSRGSSHYGFVLKMVLDCREYRGLSADRTIDNETIYANNYEYSDIRTWLTDTFYNIAFSENQKSLILTTLVDNSARSTNPNNNATYWNDGVNDYACENTEDKIFLLSVQEITNTSYGFSANPGANNTLRRKNCTDYAEAQGCQPGAGHENSKETLWWLRTPSWSNYRSAYRTVFGGSLNGYDVPGSFFGVVPALKISRS